MEKLDKFPMSKTVIVFPRGRFWNSNKHELEIVAMQMNKKVLEMHKISLILDKDS